MLGTQRARGAQVPGLRQNPRSCELDSATKSGYCRTQGHCVTGCPDARTHRRVPRPGATGNAVRAAHRDRRRSEMRSPWAGRARASPGRSSAAPPSPAAAPRRGPSAAATGRPGGRRASPSRSPSPPAALRPRRRPQLSGAGRAPAEKNPRQAPPRRRAPPRPRPPSCFPPPPSLRTCGCARAAGGCFSAHPAHAASYGPPGRQASFRGPSGVEAFSGAVAPGFPCAALPAPELTPTQPRLPTRKSSLGYVSAVLWPPKAIRVFILGRQPHERLRILWWLCQLEREQVKLVSKRAARRGLRP